MTQGGFEQVSVHIVGIAIIFWFAWVLADGLHNRYTRIRERREVKEQRLRKIETRIQSLETYAICTSGSEKTRAELDSEEAWIDREPECGPVRVVKPKPSKMR